jgi:hypothetical protein
MQIDESSYTSEASYPFQSACQRKREVRDRDGNRHWVRCGSRLKAVCEGCSALAVGDWQTILRSGIFGSDPTDQFVFLTLTAPSFGRCHRVAKLSQPSARCQCGVTHDPLIDADLRGVPIDRASYSYEECVEWNYHSGRLWNNLVCRLRGSSPSLVYASVREWRDRGAIHLHVVLRMPSSEAMSAREVRRIARTVTATVAEGRSIAWGSAIRARSMRRDAPAGQSLAYLAKQIGYLTKSADQLGRALASESALDHWRRLNIAASRIWCPRCGDTRVSEALCRATCHRQWGARSHVVTVSDGRGRSSKDRPIWSFRANSHEAEGSARRVVAREHT